MGVAQARTADIALIAAASGYDALWIDLEHNATTLDTTSMLCSAALGAGLATVVRVPSHDPHDMTRALDVGAQGLIVPHVNSAQEARRIVASCKFPPIGHRSVTVPNALIRYRPMALRDMVELINRESIITAMIETPEAVDNASEIAAVDGIDMLLIGPVDLTAEMGIIGQFDDSRFLSAVNRVADACRESGKVFGIAGIKDMELLAKFWDIGLRFINVGNDTAFLTAGARTSHDQVRALASRKRSSGADIKAR